MKKFTIRERDIIWAAKEFTCYGCIFPKNSPGYRAYDDLKRKIKEYKKELRKSGALRPGQHFKFWLNSNTDCYPLEKP